MRLSQARTAEVPMARFLTLCTRFNIDRLDCNVLVDNRRAPSCTISSMSAATVGSSNDTLDKWRRQAPFFDTRWNIEYSIHGIPPRILKELKQVFPDVDLESGLIVPTFQPTEKNLVSIGAAIEEEKDLCLENFYNWGSSVCDAIAAHGYWADMADPTSGYPMRGQQGTSFYPEVYGVQYLLGYELLNTGCCKVISHPKWGTKVYPASLFTTAPLPVLQEVLRAASEAT